VGKYKYLNIAGPNNYYSSKTFYKGSINPAIDPASKITI